MKYVLVDALSQYRMRYLVEVPDDKEDWALDIVTSEEAKEFSQLHLGELILSHRPISKEEAIDLFRKDNSYLTSWADNHIWNSALTPYREKEKTDEKS